MASDPLGDTIDGLTALTGANTDVDNDLIPIHDASTTTTRSISVKELVANTLAILQSGIGAVERPVQTALRAITRSGDYDTTANFNTSIDALTETIGIKAIHGPAAGLNFKFPTNAEATNVNVMTFVPYEFGMAIKLAGSGQNHDNRLELFLGSADTSTPQFSLRHNGSNLGAQIIARDSGDTDGVRLDFLDDIAKVAWGDAGPFITKISAGILAMRNPSTVGEAQNLRIANTYTVGGALEYLQLGWDTNRAKVQSVGSGGGTQRPLDLNGSLISFQAGGTGYWKLNAGGNFTADTDNTYDIGASGATRPRTIYAGTRVVAPAYTVGATAGASFSGAVTNITVVNGIVTAAS